MLLNEATRVQDMLLERLREADLERVLRHGKSQFLDIEDSVFVELVLSDGAELERVEAIVVELSDTLRSRGTKIESIVRAMWDVTEVKSQGPAYGKDGAPRAAEEFYVALRSGSRLHTVAVETTWGTTDAVRHKLSLARPTGKFEEKQIREELIRLIRRFVEYELRQGGLAYWDPLRHPRRELNEAAVLFFSTQRD